MPSRGIKALIPKGGIVADYLRSGWLEHGCIVFSQYYDSAHWLARTLAGVFPQERIGLMADWVSP